MDRNPELKYTNVLWHIPSTVIFGPFGRYINQNNSSRINELIPYILILEYSQSTKPEVTFIKIKSPTFIGWTDCNPNSLLEIE